MAANNHLNSLNTQDEPMKSTPWLIGAAVVIVIIIFVAMAKSPFESQKPSESAQASSGSLSLAAPGANSQSKTGMALSRSDLKPLSANASSEPATFAEAIAKLAPADQAFLNAFNTKTYGLLQYTSLEERQWKLARAFPTPEQVLKLRGQPVLRVLSDVEIAALDSTALSNYLLQLYLNDNADARANRGEYMFYRGGIGRDLLKRLDTSLPAFLEASTIDIASEFAGERLSRAALESAYAGDATLALEILSRFSESNKEISNKVGVVVTAFDSIARAQYSNCSNNRYFGNPRTVESLARAMSKIPC